MLYIYHLIIHVIIIKCCRFIPVTLHIHAIIELTIVVALPRRFYAFLLNNPGSNIYKQLEINNGTPLITSF